MTSIKSAFRRPAVFRLPDLKLRKKGAQAGRMSQVTFQLSTSDQRILDNTPKLKELRDFLKASRERVP